MAKAFFIKLLIVLLCIALFLYVIFQIFSFGNADYTTVTALTYIQEDTMELDGVFARQENVLSISNQNVSNYLYEDGSKVSAGTIVVESYSDKQSVVNAQNIKKLEKEIDILIEAQNPGAVYSVHTDTIDIDINNEIGNIIDSVYAGNVGNITTIRESLLLHMNKRLVSIKAVESFDDRISQLQAEIDVLKKTISTPEDYVATEISGNFVSFVDGYEDILKFENIDGLTVSEFNDIMSEEAHFADGLSSDVKIISGFEWKYIALVDKKNISDFEKGMKYNMRFLFNQPIEVPVTVSYINTDDESDKAIVVFSSNYMVKELAQARKHDSTIIFRTLKGLKVPKEAVRFDNDVAGVYVKYGDDVQFKEIDKIFESDTYILSRIYPIEQKNTLHQFDEIIIEGENLVAIRSNRTG